MRILFATSEVVPFSKTGGLADVAGALPEAIAQLGHEVRVVSPFYAAQFHRDHPTVPHDGLAVSLDFNGIPQTFKLRRPANWKGKAQHYFVEHPNYYSRSGLYVELSTGRDYPDNDVRFAFFSRGILELLSQAKWVPEIIHLNDWQTALAAAYLKLKAAEVPSLQKTRTLLTVHNMAYQGVFPLERFPFLGFDEALAEPMGPFEFFGKINFLKAGLVYADKINTVSPTYAREIQSSSEYGAGLEGILRQRSADLSGILNGVDVEIWNPATDKLIPATYDAAHLEGKAANKRALCEACGFARERWDRPLVGMITRLAEQKGLTLVANAAERLFALDVNLVLLGTGDPALQKTFGAWNESFAGRFRGYFAFDNALAHLIEAGADIFLMPSRYEPCGLNQMYSLRYGTIPVVRATGGLADTVIDADARPEEGNGFVFNDYTEQAMLAALRRAVAAYGDRARWTALQRRGMAADFSWTHAAGEYLRLYQAAIDR
ncbi:MAG TPA: glycogen synthase GlgA [bacterium]|nr:glycogen synthase GlgA [bacterium]